MDLPFSFFGAEAGVGSDWSLEKRVGGQQRRRREGTDS